MGKDKKSKKELSREWFIKIIKYLFILLSIVFAILLIINGGFNLKDEIEKNSGMWENVIKVYVGIGLLTFTPVLDSILFKETELSSKIDFQDSKFSNGNKERLDLFNKRMKGTLLFWKNNVKIYRNLHYYSVIWTTLISVVMPILIQLINSGGKLLITIISVHSAILIAFHKGIKIENNYKRFRICESNFYDAYREILDYHGSNQEEDEKKIREYFNIVRAIRKDGRETEIDNIPNVDYSNIKKGKNE